MYSVVKQRLKCNTGKVCNCVHYTHTANNSLKLLNEIFGERVISRNLWPPCSPDLTPPDFYLWGAAKSAVYCYRPRTLNEWKTAITAYIRNISQADLQKVFANKIIWVQAYIDACGHTSITFYKCTATFQTHCIRHPEKSRQGHVQVFQLWVIFLYLISLFLLDKQCVFITVLD
jgi:hypothetical protein